MSRWLEAYIVIGMAIQALSVTNLRKLSGPMWAAVVSVMALTMIWPLLVATFIRAFFAALTEDRP